MNRIYSHIEIATIMTEVSRVVQSIHGSERSNIRISMPEQIEMSMRSYLSNVTLNFTSQPFKGTFGGIEVIPAYENKITIFHISAPHDPKAFKYVIGFMT